ncbi:MAG: PilZ domain-containing protein [Opitutae bacterium]|nr:PilZ domain-containing protein [Opitutae bacterium]
MLLFRRIFNFEKAQVAQLAEKRLNIRYVPGAAFPLQACLHLPSHDWAPVRVLNLSGNGIGLLLPNRETKPAAGQDVEVKLVLGGSELVLEGRVAHVEPHIHGLDCGVGLRFVDYPAQKAYLQLLEPVAIGQSLQAVPAERVVQNEPQFIKQVFRGEGDCVLTVWLATTPGTPLHSFEFRMHDYFCRADVQSGVLEAYLRESSDSHKAKLSNPVFDLSGGLQDEIRQLFRWILPNVSAAVPDDVRAFLHRFAA